MYFLRYIAPRAAVLAVLLSAAGLSAQEGAPADREAKLIAVLQSDVSAAEKAIACKQLAVCGSKNAVPALAPFLSNPDLASWARIALEVIPGEEANQALRDALSPLQGRLLIGAINSLGVRRDAKAVEPLAARLKDADAGVASAAAVALGRIATPEAETALAGAMPSAPPAVREAVAEGTILCAEAHLAAGKADDAAKLYDLVRGAEVSPQRLREATRGAILARGAAGVPLLVEEFRSGDKDRFNVSLRTARELGGAEVAKALGEELARLTPAVAEQAQPAPAVLSIIKAEYGAGDKWVDVTAAVSAAVIDNAISVAATSSLAGEDPAPGVVKALRVTYALGDKTEKVEIAENDTFAVGERLPEGDPRMVGLIYALGDVGQAEAMPVLLGLARDGAWSARLAAVRVLGRIGDASVAPVLLDAARGSGQLREAAIESLTQLQGDEVDAAIVAGLEQATGTSRAVLIQLVGERAIRSAAPALLKDVESADDAIRMAAVAALGMTADFNQLDVLIAHLVAPKSAQEAEVARIAVQAATTRLPDRDAAAGKLLAAVATAPAPAQAVLLDLVGLVGGQAALKGVGAAARSGDDSLEDAASQVLGQWMTADAAPVLLDLARTGTPKYRIRALRAYIRVARQLEVPDPQRIVMCQQVLPLLKRDDEKKLIIEVLRRYPAAEGLPLVTAYLDSPALKADAVDAAVWIGEKIVDANPAAVAQAMKRVVAAGGDAQLIARAKALLEKTTK